MRTSTEFDPISYLLAPPPDESAEERSQRLRIEADAKRVSDEIDEALKADRAALKRKRKAIKVLLLGQAESGKSTTLKNFQMMYASADWLAERASWRAVIQLNLVRSVNHILTALADELSDPTLRSPTPSFAPSLSSPTAGPLGAVDGDDADPTSHPTSDRHAHPLRFTDTHRMLKLRLAPLRRVEADLQRKLGVAAEELPDMSDPAPAYVPYTPPAASAKPREATVRSWKTALLDTRDRLRDRSARGMVAADHGHGVDEASEIIAGCGADITALWRDETVHEMLHRRGTRMEETAGFFLNDVDRIARRNYEPTDDDVLRARLRTTGVQEHWFSTPNKLNSSREDWVIYDVGGCRTLRRAWIPFFENVTSIIFLAPISCFDERLTEDVRVNRLEDTMLLWNGIVSTKLLARTTVILFMNKVDLLESKIAAGVLVARHLPSYGARPNEADAVIKYLRGKFKDTHRRCSPEPRPFYCYPTTVVDQKATQKTLDSIRDGIVMGNLRVAEMIE